MKNAEITMDGTVLTIKVDLAKSFGPSQSGKTIIIGTTEGNQKVGKDPSGADVFLGLTAYKKP
jgi:hypothetical protein